MIREKKNFHNLTILALSSLGPIQFIKESIMCTLNSTDKPTHTIKFTTETALI